MSTTKEGERRKERDGSLEDDEKILGCSYKENFETVI